MKKKKESVSLENFGFPIFREYYHDVNIHLINRKTLTTLENEKVTEKKSIFYLFSHGKSQFLNIVYGFGGIVIIPKEKILYITIDNVHII